MSIEEKTNKEIQPSDHTNAIALLDELNPKQRLFLMLITEGKRTTDAYKQAGYEGDNHSAYVLKARLNKHLEVIALSKNMSKADLLNSLSQLQDLPVKDRNGNDVSSVNMREKLRILSLQAKVLDGMGQKAPSLTQINIIRKTDSNAVVTKKDELQQGIKEIIDITKEGTSNE